MNKYSISFRYVELNSKAHKYIYADNEDEAIQLFKGLYEDYSIEIIGIREIGKVNE